MQIKVCEIISHPRITGTSYVAQVKEYGGDIFRAELGFPYTDPIGGGGIYYSPSGWWGKKATFCLVAMPEQGTPVIISFLAGSLISTQKYTAEIPFDHWYPGHPNWRFAKRPLLWETDKDDYGGMIRLYSASRNKLTVYDRAISFYNGRIPTKQDILNFEKANPAKELPADELFYANASIGSYDFLDLPNLPIERDRYFRTLLGDSKLYKQLKTVHGWAGLTQDKLVEELAKDAFKAEGKKLAVNLSRFKIRRENLLAKKVDAATHEIDIDAEKDFWLEEDPEEDAHLELNPKKWIPEPPYIHDDFSLNFGSSAANRVTINLGKFGPFAVNSPPSISTSPSPAELQAKKEFYRIAFRPAVTSIELENEDKAVHLLKISAKRSPKIDSISPTNPEGTIDQAYEVALDAKIEAAQKGNIVLDTIPTGNDQTKKVTVEMFGRVGTMPLAFVPGRYTIMALKELRDKYKLQTYGVTPPANLTDDQLTSLITSDPDLSDEDHWSPVFV